MKVKTFTIEDIENAVNALNEKGKFECTARQLLVYLRSKSKRYARSKNN